MSAGPRLGRPRCLRAPPRPARGRWTGLRPDAASAIALALALIVVAPGASAQAPLPPEARDLAAGFNAAYAAGDWARAVELGERIAELAPHRPHVEYNLGCVNALSGDAEAALDWLERAARDGLHRPSRLEEDTDLDAIRSLPRFARILEGVRLNEASFDEAVRRRFAAEPPLITLPPRDDPKHPLALVVALHGYGGHPEGWPSFWRPVTRRARAILAAPRAVHQLGVGAYWGDADEADLVVELTIAYVEERHAIDHDRVVLTGFSQGGTMAIALGRRHPDQFAGVIPMAASYDPETDAPQPVVGTAATRWAFMVGEYDDRHLAPCRRAAKDFAAAGYDVKLRVYPGVGHAFPRFSEVELGKALKFVLRHRQ